jgi:hypothetical protein
VSENKFLFWPASSVLATSFVTSTTWMPVFPGLSCNSCISARLGPDEGSQDMEDTQPEMAVQPESSKTPASAVPPAASLDKLALLMQHFLKN